MSGFGWCLFVSFGLSDLCWWGLGGWLVVILGGFCGFDGWLVLFV